MGQSEHKTFPCPRHLGHVHTGKGGRRRGNIFQMGMGGPGNFPLCSPYVVRHDSWAVAAACCHTCRVAGTSSLNLSPLYQTTSAKYWSTQAPLLLAISQPLCIGDPLGEEMRLDAALSSPKRPSTHCCQAVHMIVFLHVIPSTILKPRLLAMGVGMCLSSVLDEAPTLSFLCGEDEAPRSG